MCPRRRRICHSSPNSPRGWLIASLHRRDMMDLGFRLPLLWFDPHGNLRCIGNALSAGQTIVGLGRTSFRVGVASDFRGMRNFLQIRML